ncbi:IclR family transcriptional regulator [Acuticoccus mangrovi]|uniref:Helix-turn-helix domain-containing protein n=1 Tax=Acuticoccus mangrovi TaxID=2796142 RepID=A0A934IKT0_9HYPH|nr:helix-turn-helix domain-containing protein [Acuticoccus mangrovi]
MGRQPRGIQSLEVGGRLLAALVAGPADMSLKELSTAAGMAPAQAHGYLASYRRTGLVEQDAATGHYRLGPFATRLAMARLRTQPALAAAVAATTRVADTAGIMATLAVWGPHGPTVIHRTDGEEVLNVNIRVGTMFALAATSPAIVFAAFGDPERTVEVRGAGGVRERLALGDLLTRDTAIGEAATAVRAAGHAILRNTPVPGVNALAAPLIDAEGDLTAAIIVMGSPARLDVAAPDGVLETLTATTSGLATAAA